MISKRKIHWPSKSQWISLVTGLMGLTVTINQEALKLSGYGVHIPPVVVADIQMAAIIVPMVCRSLLSMMSGLPGQDPNATVTPTVANNLPTVTPTVPNGTPDGSDGSQ